MRARQPPTPAPPSAFGKAESHKTLQLLDQKLLGGKRWLCGDASTIADLSAAAIVSLGALVGADEAPYARVRRWMNKIRAIPEWSAVNEGFDAWVAATRQASAQDALRTTS
ncbi:MAG TPA: glutathione binding-like protein [Polyangiales bacterium]|jgi:glutathione S-transferase|nr:glutathione binding-like protein [Polyangiales bacterium]